MTRKNNTDLLKALVEVRVENPVQRRTDVFIDLLLNSTADDFSQGDFILMLLSAVPGDRVSDKHSDKVLHGIMRFIGEHNIDTKLPTLWGDQR